MWKSIRNLVTSERSAQIVILLLLILAGWWLFLQGIQEEEPQLRDLLWAASYQLVAILGGIWGISISRSWGGLRSVMGRAIFALALGLLLQAFGQSTFSFYNLILQVEVPYPSIADVGYFGSIPVYVYGIFLLAKASGIKVSLRSFVNQIQAILIPAIMLGLSYFFFLRDYEFDWSSPLRVFLDFGYPFGQAIYVSIAILTFILSRKVLGGIMRSKIFFILLALVAQYVADYNFLYQVANETWRNGGYGDLLYLLSYIFMALGLLQLKIKAIQSSTNEAIV